nr:hypothetical protein [Tanacetum cinerariifolium]
MSSITTQQTKLDLELVPKENRLDIRKCNGRIPHGLKTREPTFVPDALALNPCYSAFLITVDVPEVYMCQFWNSVDFHMTRPSGSGKVAKKQPSVEKIKPAVTSEGTGDILGVLDVTKDDSTESETELWGNDKDDSNDEND